GRTVLGADVRDVIRQIGETEVKLEAEWLSRARRKRGRDGGENRSMHPGRRLAAAVHTRLVIDHRRRVVVVEANVVLSRPDHLDWLPELAREHCRFRRVV